MPFLNLLILECGLYWRAGTRLMAIANAAFLPKDSPANKFSGEICSKMLGLKHYGTWLGTMSLSVERRSSE